MTNKLEKMCELQKELMKRLNVVAFDPGFRDERQIVRQEEHPNMMPLVESQTRNMLHAITCEIGEISDEINWKPWKKTIKDVDLDKLYTELIDVQHFILEIMLMWGMTAEDIFNYYEAKMIINHKRQDHGY